MNLSISGDGQYRMRPTKVQLAKGFLVPFKASITSCSTKELEIPRSEIILDDGDYSRFRVNLPAKAALGYDIWILVGVGLGFWLPWMREPPFVDISPIDEACPDELWEIVQKWLKKRMVHKCPVDFPTSLSPLFCIESSIIHVSMLIPYLPFGVVC